MRCWNENCQHDPLQSGQAICISPDGDFVCDTTCKAEYEKQKDYFFTHLINDETKCREWLLGGR